MREPFRKVDPAEPFFPSALEHNAMIDAALLVRFPAGNKGIKRQPFFDNGTVAMIKNDSGSTVARFGVLGVDSILITEADDVTSFSERPMFNGKAPVCNGVKGPGMFGVLLDEIEDGEVGRAMFGGVAICNVNIDKEKHIYCEIDDGETSALKSVFFGSNRILYKPSGTGNKLCAVQIHGGIEYGATVAVRVADDGNGSAGVDEMSDCTFVYDVSYLHGDPTVSADICVAGADPEQPEGGTSPDLCPRLTEREYVAGGDGHIGIGVMNEQCEFELIYVCEQLANPCCSTAS